MNEFARTLGGRISGYVFRSETIVWVEGTTDRAFYLTPLDGLPVRLEAAHGRDEIRKVVETVLDEDLPVVAVYDGDYAVLVEPRPSDARIVRLDRHSMENYLAESQALARAATAYGCCAELEKLGRAVSAAEAHAAKSLRELLMLDVACWLSECDGDVFPPNAAALLTRRGCPVFSEERIEKAVRDAREHISVAAIEEAANRIDKYLRRRRVVDLVPGHFMLSLVREILCHLVCSEGRKRPTIDNEGLVALLAALVWKTAQGGDHRRLRQALRKGVRVAREKRAMRD